MTNTTIRDAIAFNIKRLMLGTPNIHSEAALAARAQIQQSTVRSILDGSIDVDVDTLSIIANALNVNAGALLSSPSSPVDPMSMYGNRIAALPADQQQRIQDFIDSIPAMHEEHALN